MPVASSTCLLVVVCRCRLKLPVLPVVKFVAEESLPCCPAPEQTCVGRANGTCFDLSNIYKWPAHLSGPGQNPSTWVPVCVSVGG